MSNITPAMAGTWLDGSQGWHNTYRAIRIAQEYGFPMSADDIAIVDAYANELETITLSTGGVIDANTIAGCIIDQMELCDRATEYLNSIAPDGYEFVWDAGELSLCASECEHVYVAGMMYVADEDVDTISRMRTVTCERCDWESS